MPGVNDNESIISHNLVKSDQSATATNQPARAGRRLLSSRQFHFAGHYIRKLVASVNSNYNIRVLKVMFRELAAML